MELVVDEWLPHYIEERDKNEFLLKFLEKIYEKCDSLVISRQGPVRKKIHRIMNKASHWKDNNQRRLFKYFITSFLRNSNKVLLIEEHTIPELPENIAKILPEDDHFLYRIALARGECVILTTDKKLKMKARALGEQFKTEILEDFCSNYIVEV